jgi:hypothetical protein
MPKYANKIVPRFDFSDAIGFSLPQRFSRSLEKARDRVEQSGYQGISEFPCVPFKGACEEELAKLETTLGIQLPAEYRQFLAITRYLKIDDGREVGGLDHNGLFVTERPWVSNQHLPGEAFLVFANFWQFADGDQLMFDLSEPIPVVAYLHEHGPLFEVYAPSFSLALWRLVHEEW